MKKKAIWTTITIILAILTARAVFSQNEEMSLGHLIDVLAASDKMWLTFAVLATFGFIYFEGRSLLTMTKVIGYPKSEWKGFIYSSADIYFSAITPSATGGQPASAYFMMADGIPGALVTATLIVNLVMYILALLFLDVVALIIRPSIFLGFGPLSKILIIVGIILLVILGVIFFMTLRHQTMLFNTAKRFIRFLNRIKIIKHVDKYIAKLDKSQAQYSDCIEVMGGKPVMLMKVFVYDVLQRLSQYFSIIFVFMATGGRAGLIPDLFVTQSFITTGAYAIPVPGGMGVTDYLMVDGYQSLMATTNAYQLEILGRGLSFYVCIIISIIAVVCGYIGIYIKNRKRKKL